jgi:hypothetical protein
VNCPSPTPRLFTFRTWESNKTLNILPTTLEEIYWKICLM